MSYNGNYITIERILENVARESGYENIDIESVLEWAGDLIKLVGLPTIFINKSTNGSDNNEDFISIVNYRGTIPNDVVSIDACRKVSLNGDNEIIGVFPMIETQDLFLDTEFTNQNFGAIVTEPYFKTVQISEDGEPEVVQISQDNSRLIGNQTYQYKINSNVIFTNFEDGYVELAYKGFPTDVNGYPMLPDDIKFIKALVWDIITNMDRLRWRQNPSPQNKSIFNYSEQQRDWYVATAITKGRIPNIDQMESLKNAWLRTIQKIDSHANGFKTNNYPEVRYTHNSRRWRTR